METAKKAALLAMLTVPSALLADDFSYNYVELGSPRTTIDTSGGEIDLQAGLRALWSHDFGKGMWRLPPALNIRLGYEQADIDEFGPVDVRGRVELQTGSVYIGIHDKIMPRLDYFGGLEYAKSFFDEDRTTPLGAGAFDSQEFERYRAEAGVRFLLIPALELNGRLLYTGYDSADVRGDIDDDGGVRLGLVFHANDVFALSLDVERGFDPVIEEMALSLRYKL